MYLTFIKYDTSIKLKAATFPAASKVKFDPNIS
jgi:hypothetical protein